MAEINNYDPDEIKKFDDVAQDWWDPKGEMRTLQTINPLRIKFITEKLEAGSPRILDIGCGGGILSEGLAKIGARVVGIDLSRASIETAREHAEQSGLSIEYQAVSVEEIANLQPESFDVITCMEMLEHVPDPAGIVAACARALKPGGHAFFSSINRTPKAFLFAIIGGEYILRLLPKGTHTYKKLIRPAELTEWSQSAGMKFARLASLMYNPFTGKFKTAYGKEDVNYMMHFIKE
jgi:2-polyprenyl-6-hydroxyphenyl methylase/3-demethylubiquinone-9 3-methyltransferase